jgi:exonuclease V gamma subunit
LDWLEQARFRWGIDARQRAEFQGEGEQRWNLAFALRRLGLGAVVKGDMRDGVVDGDAPLERAAGLSTALLAQLAQFATALYEARKAWVGKDSGVELGTAKPLREWCALLTDWCTRFLGDGDGAVSEHRTQLINTIIPSLAAAAPEGLMLRSDAVLRLLESPLESLSSGQGSGGGGIPVADLCHYAGTPARMVLVAGLGSETFPRHEDRPGWHPLATARELGDPDRREADRHALLLALLGCGERLVLTYQGGSDEDGKERPPSTPLADLLAAVDGVATRPDGESASQNIFIKHGLNGFSPDACAAETRAVARSFLASDYAGAAALLEPDRLAYPGLWSQVLPPPERSMPLTLSDLCSVMQEPCRIFVRRLGLRLPEEADEPSQEDALALDSLARWSLRDRMLHCRLTGGDEKSLRMRAEAAGELPRALYGENIWNTTLDELPGIDEQGLTAIAESVQLKIGDRVIASTLPAGWYRRRDGNVVYCSASRRSEKKLLPVIIGLLCLSLTENVTQVDTWFRKDKKAKVLNAPDHERAKELLADCCRLYRLAECLPLPFWPQAYEEMLRLKDRVKKDPTMNASLDRLLLEAWSVWTENRAPGNAGAPENLLPATRACFRGLDNPFTWTPKLVDDWLPQPGSSLAWRLFCFVSQWEKAAGGES